jgi:Na+/melibiose symporter-like transporter
MLQTSSGKYRKLSFDVTSFFPPLTLTQVGFTKNQHQMYEKYAASDLLEIYKV